jgi:hypothetical protein
MKNEMEMKKALLKQLIAEMDGVEETEAEEVIEDVTSPCEAMDDDDFDLKKILNVKEADSDLDLLEDEMEDEEEEEEDDGVIRIGVSQALQGIRTPDKKIIKKTPPKISIKKG